MEKIIELPEHRLKTMLKQGEDAIDEIFIKNIAERIPVFLTASIVQIAKTLTL